MKKISILTLLLFLLCLSSCASSKTYDVKEYRTTMQFHEDFKILQITDIHLGIESDLEKQLNVVKSYIQEANPDLIILTGDNFMYGSKEIVKNLIKTLNDECRALTEKNNRLTKFAITFGNHDNQGDYPRYFINEVVLSYTTNDGDEIKDNKYAAFIDYEDDDLYGLTNYYIDLVDDREKSLDTVDVKYRIHIIDSNTDHFTGIKYQYDVIHTEQLEHAINIYNHATKDKDYIGLAFFHIPFEEFQFANEQYQNTNNNIGQGSFLEDALFPYENNGSYATLKQANISAFIVGHNHKIAADVIYNGESNNTDDKAILSFGVKATNQLYHSDDMIGYKTITLKDNMTKEQFLSIKNVNENFINVMNRNSQYEE